METSFSSSLTYTPHISRSITASALEYLDMESPIVTALILWAESLPPDPLNYLLGLVSELSRHSAGKSRG